MAGSIITTGINIVATGTNRAIGQVRDFGRALGRTERDVSRFANHYDRTTGRMQRSNLSMHGALATNWQSQYDAAVARSGQAQGRALADLERRYDRTFRNIGNKYQSMVMGGVAVAMSGVGMHQVGTAMLGSVKTALDQARDYETVMSQIQFYGQKTKEEMEGINKEIFKMGFELPVKTSEIATSVLGAQKLGYSDTEEASTMAKEASKLQFMSLDQLDGEQSIKFISHMRKLTGYASDEVDLLTDKIIKTADVSAASPESLWRTIQSSRSAFDALGGDEDSFLTLTGVMSDRLQPKQAGMALSSFSGGVNMAEKAGRENRGTRGAYYNELTAAMGGGLDSYGGDMLKYIDDVAQKSKDLWGEGTERTGNLQSIFGKSAMDLFYAVDAYSGQTGRTMGEMRDEIINAEGHAEKLMDVLMNGSYGTEKRLEALVEQFQILFGTLLRPVFNKILTGLTFLLQKVNEFIVAHPKIAKALGYGFGLAGLLLTAGGAALMFGGGLIAIYASLANIVIQMARHNRMLGMLGAGYSTAGQMVKQQLLAPFKTLGKVLLRLTGITFFLWLAWKNDFLKIKTNFQKWRADIGAGLTLSGRMFKQFSEGNRVVLNKMFDKAERDGGLDSWVAVNLTKARMLWEGIKDIWSDGELTNSNYMMLNDAGLIPFIEKVYETKTAVMDFWKGFQSGMKDGIELVKTLLGPLIPIWKWISEKVLALFQHFGFFENVNKGIGSQWEQWGQKIGYLVGSVIAVRIAIWGWMKAFKLVVKPFTTIWKLGKKIFSIFKNFKGLLKTIGGMMARTVLGRKIAGVLGGYGARANARRNTGRYSTIPNARQNVDPATGRPNGRTSYVQPTTWRERRQLRREQRRASGGMQNGGYVGRRTRAERRSGAPDTRRTSNATQRSRGIRGRTADVIHGRRYVPEQRTDRRGRSYNQIRTRDGRVMRSTADGRVNGRHVRTGGLAGRARATGAFFGRYLGNERGAVGGSAAQRNSRAIQRAAARNNRIANRAGTGGRRGRLGGVMRLGQAAGRGGGGLVKMMGKGLKGLGKLGGKAGKLLFKGLGKVLIKGIPFIFKSALRLIPFLGWALLIWDAVRLIWGNWDWIKEKAGLAWDWIKGKALGIWNWIKTDGVAILGSAWEWIKTTAGNVWNWIKTTAGNAWNWVKTDGVRLMGEAWAWIKGKAGEAWQWVKDKAGQAWNGIKSWATQKMLAFFSWLGTKASNTWDNIKTWASNAWTSVKETASSILSNLFQPIKDAWDTARSYVTNNPITQTIKQVTQKISDNGGGITGAAKTAWSYGKKLLGHRTGLWNVPKDDYVAKLHAGEMVLTRKEAQIMRQMVGSENGSIARTLLGDREQTDIKPVPKVQKRPQMAPKITVQQAAATPQAQTAGNTTVTFGPGAIQMTVQNASSSEMKKAAKQMFDEFKRMVELQNMQHYKPARPRAR